MSEHEADFATDMLRGADEIAGYLFGDPAQRRKVYHLVSSSNLPFFKLGIDDLRPPFGAPDLGA